VKSRDASKKLEAARRDFDKWAPRYEEDRRSRRIAGMQQEAFEALELEADDRFLDVGCGSGAAVRRAASIVRRAVGVDLSPGMIKRAEALAAGLPNAEFLLAESSRLPFEDAAFTAVLCTTSFHHYPDPEGAVREMARVLSSGGRVVIGDASADRPGVRFADWFLQRFDKSHVKLYRSEEFADFLYGAGFRDVAARTLWRGGYAIVRASKP
jgi:ubiquinone/menaquinone biosynthesis C-methylase UbiE